MAEPTGPTNLDYGSTGPKPAYNYTAPTGANKWIGDNWSLLIPGLGLAGAALKAPKIARMAIPASKFVAKKVFSKKGAAVGAGGAGLALATNALTDEPSAGTTTATPTPTTTKTNTNTDPNDRYSQWGGQDSFNSLLSGFQNDKSSIFNSAKDAANIYGSQQKISILDFLDSLRSSQDQLDERGIQAELAKKQGYQGITDMVGRGIRSGGAMLASRNASSSSGAEAIARAYGDIGHRQAADVGNQYNLENRDIGIEQGNLETQRQAGSRRLGEEKNQAVNKVVISARDELGKLDARMADASMPERIQIEQEKEAIKNEVMTILSQYDQMLADESAKVRPISGDERRRQAFELANAGQGAENPFNFTSQVPAQLQGTGPFASELPIFTFPRSRRRV